MDTNNETKSFLPKPFLKWFGGKSRLVDKLLANMPKHISHYHEPFMGGAALFFGLLRAGLLKGANVSLSDINQELVETFVAIRDNVEDVIQHLRQHFYDKEYYYQVRSIDPDDLESSERAARMIFLNRTGFNGLYRVNSKGKFNVGFGRYKNPTICDDSNLHAVSSALKDVSIRVAPFSDVMKKASKGHVVYLDPPYVPVSDTSNFVSYSKDGFCLQDQEQLAQVFEKLSEIGVTTLLSNSDTPWVRNRYRKYRLVPVQVRRNISSKGELRGTVGELIILGQSVERD